MPRFTVSVTTEDIRLGMPCDAELCAVARAILRMTGCPASVGVERIEVRRHGRVLTIPTPPEVADFVAEFDSSHHMGRDLPAPFSFAIDLLDEAEEAIATAKGG